MKSFGEYIRGLRLEKGMLLREVAAALDIDPSLMSRIEHGEKRMTREQVLRLAGIVKVREDDLLVHYLSDRVVYELRDEKLALRAMQVAEEKISYLIKSAKPKR